MDGYVARGYDAVAGEFERNFTERGDLGAAFAAVVDGEAVVDLWGGVADRLSGREWDRDTLQVIFSGTKGLVAVCMLIAIERGLLALDAPVCDSWPEFAASGKAGIRVRDVLSHTARLPGIRKPLALEDQLAPERMAALIAEQAPEPDPRASFLYHRQTFGWICAELIHRLDGRRLGSFFADEVAAPLDLELWIGLPPEHEDRVATLEYGSRWGTTPRFDGRLLAEDALMRSVWANPDAYPRDRIPWNTRPFHAAEIPGAGAIGTARSLARLYGCLARGGEIDGMRILRPDTIELGRRELSRGIDPFLDVELAFGAGFQLQTRLLQFGPPAGAFGHGGVGGSIHCAWPEERTGVSYAMNQLRDDPGADRRPQALLHALHAAVRGTRAEERHAASAGG